MSNNTKKAAPKQYSNKSRKPQSLIDTMAKYGDTAINTLAGGIGVAAGFAANELRKLKKFQNEQRGLRNKAHMERFLKVKKSTKPDIVVK